MKKIIVVILTITAISSLFTTPAKLSKLLVFKDISYLNVIGEF